MSDGKAAHMLDGRRILVVEDEYFLADDLARTLGRQGVEVVGPVGTLDAAVRLAEDETIDCAILDINLRGEMAFPVADRLDAAGIPFVFATGYSRAVIPDRFSAVPHLEKPLETERVAELLSQAMAAAAGGGGSAAA